MLIKISDFYLNEDYPGVIFESLGHPIESTVNHWGDVIREEYNEEQVVIRMVGDDREHIYFIDELVPYDGHICFNCGQLGCAHE